MVCMAIIHFNMKTLTMNQWITAYRDTVNANFKAIGSHGFSWMTIYYPENAVDE